MLRKITALNIYINYMFHCFGNLNICLKNKSTLIIHDSYIFLYNYRAMFHISTKRFYYYFSVYYLKIILIHSPVNLSYYFSYKCLNILL